MKDSLSLKLQSDANKYVSDSIFFTETLKTIGLSKEILLDAIKPKISGHEYNHYLTLSQEDIVSKLKKKISELKFKTDSFNKKIQEKFFKMAFLIELEKAKNNLESLKNNLLTIIEHLAPYVQAQKILDYAYQYLAHNDEAIDQRNRVRSFLAQAHLELADAETTFILNKLTEDTTEKISQNIKHVAENYIFMGTSNEEAIYIRQSLFEIYKKQILYILYKMEKDTLELKEVVKLHKKLDILPEDFNTLIDFLSDFIEQKNSSSNTIQLEPIKLMFEDIKQIVKNLNTVKLEDYNEISATIFLEETVNNVISTIKSASDKNITGLDGIASQVERIQFASQVEKIQFNKFIKTDYLFAYEKSLQLAKNIFLVTKSESDKEQIKRCYVHYIKQLLSYSFDPPNNTRATMSHALDMMKRDFDFSIFIDKKSTLKTTEFFFLIFSRNIDITIKKFSESPKPKNKLLFTILKNNSNFEDEILTEFNKKLNFIYKLKDLTGLTKLLYQYIPILNILKKSEELLEDLNIIKENMTKVLKFLFQKSPLFLGDRMEFLGYLPLIFAIQTVENLSKKDIPAVSRALLAAKKMVDRYEESPSSFKDRLTPYFKAQILYDTAIANGIKGLLPLSQEVYKIIFETFNDSINAPKAKKNYFVNIVGMLELTISALAQNTYDLIVNKSSLHLMLLTCFKIIQKYFELDEKNYEEKHTREKRLAKSRSLHQENFLFSHTNSESERNLLNEKIANFQERVDYDHDETYKKIIEEIFSIIEILTVAFPRITVVESSQHQTEKNLTEIVKNLYDLLEIVFKKLAWRFSSVPINDMETQVKNEIATISGITTADDASLQMEKEITSTPAKMSSFWSKPGSLKKQAKDSGRKEKHLTFTENNDILYFEYNKRISGDESDEELDNIQGHCELK